MAQNGKKASSKRGKKATSGTPPQKASITVDYIKSNHYRVITVHGVYGGVSPSGDIHMAVWNQRRPYPQQIVQEFDPQTLQAGKELSRTVRETDIIREIEVGLVFNAEMARVIITWLEEKIKAEAEMEKALNELGLLTPETAK